VFPVRYELYLWPHRDKTANFRQNCNCATACPTFQVHFQDNLETMVELCLLDDIISKHDRTDEWGVRIFESLQSLFPPSPSARDVIFAG
jgi:hypothetical protein